MFTLILGHGSFTVALYGSRIMLIHFPLLFVIGKVFNFKDVLKIGKHLVFIGIGMTLIMALQFYSPQAAWINRGIAGDEAGSGFAGAAGFYRVPGTFSFISGLVAFYAMLLPFILYFLKSKISYISKKALVMCGLAYIIALPMSISRAMFFQTVLSFVFLISVSINNRKSLLQLVSIIAIACVIFSLSINFKPIAESVSAFENRFENANKVEGGLDGVLIDRFLGGMLQALNAEDVSVFGKGIGMGSNAGATILGAKGKFLIAEGEWGRIIGERGFILGLAIILLRIILISYLFIRCWSSTKRNEVLPWLLFSAGFILIIQGQWSQPTTLGFSILFGGLILASLNGNKLNFEE